MRLLVLGGTEFVGRALVQEAVARGWQVDAFNRGNRETPAGARLLKGDRRGDLSVLSAGEWDLVVDTWSFEPSAVRASAASLASRAAHYSYISTCSVYGYPASKGLDESAPVIDGTPGDGEGEYPHMKAGSERAVLDAFGDRSTLVRAGLILGPYENIGRLPWWLTRMARGGPVLAPGPDDLPLTYIDARDLAIWTLDNPTTSGPYNLVSPPGFTTTRELLETCAAVTGSNAELRWIDAETVLAAGIQPWMDLPVWIPPGEGHDTMHTLNVDRALATGLRNRPVQETVADTWTWLQSIGGVAPQRPDRPSPGLDPAVEAKVLQGSHM